MEKLKIEISQLSFSQKLHLIEELWADLSKDDKNIVTPEWHNGVLDEREKYMASGTAKISNWEESKERIKRNVNCK